MIGADEIGCTFREENLDILSKQDIIDSAVFFAD